MDFNDQQQGGRAGLGIGGHFTSVKRDLSQVQDLLRDAVANLLADTLAVRTASAMQQQAALDADPETRAKLLELGRTIDERSNAFLVSLQFQDMVTQLLDHVRVRIDALEAGCGTRAWSGEADDNPGDSVSTGDGEVQDFARMLKGKPVMSCDMRAGDVELF